MSKLRNRANSLHLITSRQCSRHFYKTLVGKTTTYYTR